MPGKKFSYLDGEVEVSVPEQKNKKNLKPKKLKKDPLSKLKGKPGKFQPDRVVMNVVLVDETKPDKYLKEFDPPVELRFKYTKTDIEKAEKDGKRLALAFWDDKKNEWVPFTKAKHGYQLIPDTNPKKGGVAVVKLSKWGDPNVGWGRI